MTTMTSISLPPARIQLPNPPIAFSMPVAKPGRLRGHVMPTREIDCATQDQLYELFRQYYTHVDHAAFLRDQAEKEWVLLLTDHDGELRGFTTMMSYDVEVEGRDVRAIFSGNTIIDRDHWGGQELVRTFGRFLASVKRQQPELPLYWFLICSGFRTYLYLPLFYREFFPRYDMPTPRFESKLIDKLGELKFPAEYCHGVVHVNTPRECLRDDLAIPSPAKMRNPHVRFFVEQNHDYRHGNELVCVAEYSLGNTRGLANTTAREILNGTPC